MDLAAGGYRVLMYYNGNPSPGLTIDLTGIVAAGDVFVLAHEDDVKIARWKEKYDKIPEDTKDPGLLKAKKALKRKMPTRRSNQQYWSEGRRSLSLAFLSDFIS